MSKKRGRPVGVYADTTNLNALGKLLTAARSKKNMALATVAAANGVSVQFISNIERSRAPLPWGMVETTANVLGIPVKKLIAANLSARSDGKTVVVLLES